MPAFVFYSRGIVCTATSIMFAPPRNSGILVQISLDVRPLTR
jgi:hypothetical protein